jgi:hypothetical protein
MSTFGGEQEQRRIVVPQMLCGIGGGARPNRRRSSRRSRCGGTGWHSLFSNAIAHALSMEQKGPRLGDGAPGTPSLTELAAQCFITVEGIRGPTNNDIVISCHD